MNTNSDSDTTRDHAGQATGTAELSLPFPPGFLGVLSSTLLNGAYKPIPQIATTAAIALVAGIVGRAYRTPTGKDLALYINLIADSGVGKDAIHDGIPDLLHHSGVLTCDRFLNRDQFASGVALHKVIIASPGLLTLQPEWGRRLREMAEGNPNAQGLRTVLTDLYAKNYYGGKRYANAEQNVTGVTFPALTFLGETTPGTFREALTPDMMEDGFMSRFLNIEYDGPRPESNDDDARSILLEDDLREYWARLVKHCLQWAPSLGLDGTDPDPKTVDVCDEERAKFVQYEMLCDSEYNRNKGNSYVQQAWSRAHLKALRLASLCAVADNFEAPRINYSHGAWARQVVAIDQSIFARSNARGDIGNDDHARERKLSAIITEYVLNGAPASYGIPPSMSPNGLVPRKYLQVRVQRKPPFSTHKLGANTALDLAIKSMIDSGYMMECKKDDIVKGYDFHGKCYRVLDLPR